MNHSLKENLITTKDASELSGYTSDYLARLVRSGEIQGKRIGHSWVISSASLETFMTKQKGRKLDRARELASSRVREYNKHNQFVQRTTRALTEKISVPKFRLEEVSLRSHSLALGVALVVVALGAVGANAAALPQVAQRASALATEISSGFVDTFGDVPTRIAVRMEEARTAVRADATRNALASRRAGYVASPVLASIDLETLRTVLVKEYRAPRATSDIAFSSSRTDAPILTVTDVYASVASAYEFFANPSNIGTTLTDAYFAIGTDAYAAVDASFSAYRTLIDASGTPMLAAAATTRDAFAHTPRLVAQVNLALGEAVIKATHAAIRTDVIAAHGLAAAAPESARIAVTLMGSTGDTLARAAEQVPARVATAYLNATAVPAVLAPRLAQAVFNAEYAVADRFVSATNAVSGRYLALVEGTGDIAYESSTNARSIVQSASRTIAFAPAALEDVTLGTLGKSAAALDSVTHLSSFAAVLPALSASEKTALAVYEAIHSAFDSANRTLVAFFTTTPETVLPTGVPKARVIAVATSTRAVPSGTQPVTTLSYPTYTTVVRGVSEDFVNQSLASLRTNVLATVAGMIQPVSSQVVQNITTIQQLNRIDSLHDLVVQNGDFRNSIFDNGIRVNARDGYFDNLTAGTTTLATTTVNGTLTISSLTLTGSLSSPGSITGSYFVSTSTNATSTFAGSINIDNAGFVYATSTRNVGIGVLSPAALLAVQNSTSTQPIFVASNAAGAEVYRITDAGFVGIGTTSPTYNLAVEGSSTLGNQAIAGYFTATTTTATSTFAGSFTVGTDKLVVNSTTGNIGIGTTSPSNAKLDIRESASGAYGIKLTNRNATRTWGIATDVGAVNDNKFGIFDVTSGGARLTIDTSGYVGIGSTSPAQKLVVSGNILTDNANNNLSAYNIINRPTNATYDAANWYQTAGVSKWIAGLLAASSGGTANADDYSIAYYNGSWNNAVTINSSGRVGIGTTSPSGTLAVAGDFFLTGSTTITGADSGIVFTGSGNHDITAAGGTLRIGTNTIIGNIEALNDTVDIGTAVTRFDKIYANEVNASTI
ncbi:MAG: helix-turn-helix domain-containing protein, partial [Candidatus Paceibacterota bacterium]